MISSEWWALEKKLDGGLAKAKYETILFLIGIQELGQIKAL